MNTTTPDAPASTTIDLAGLPEPVIRSIRQLVESLRTPPVSPTADPLTEARAELHREIMEGMERKWAMYGPDREDAK